MKKKQVDKGCEIWGKERRVGPEGCYGGHLGGLGLGVVKISVNIWCIIDWILIKKLQKYTPSALADQLVRSATSGSSCGDLAGTEET